MWDGQNQCYRQTCSHCGPLSSGHVIIMCCKLSWNCLVSLSVKCGENVEKFGNSSNFYAQPAFKASLGVILSEFWRMGWFWGYKWISFSYCDTIWSVWDKQTHDEIAISYSCLLMCDKTEAIMTQSGVCIVFVYSVRVQLGHGTGRVVALRYQRPTRRWLTHQSRHTVLCGWLFSQSLKVSLTYKLQSLNPLMSLVEMVRRVRVSGF